MKAKLDDLLSIFLSALNKHLLPTPLQKNPAAHSPCYSIPVGLIRPRLHMALTVDLAASR